MEKPIKYIFWTININLLIAFLMFLTIVNFNLREIFKFIYEAKLNFLIGATGLYSTGYYVGYNLWKLKKSKNTFAIIHGIVAIFLVLIIGTLIGSSVGFFQEGLPSFWEYGDLSDCIFDYYFKPMYWILFLGFIPTLISGLILGYYLKKLPNSSDL